ncbi:MAG: FecR domain-containing protein, partial [Spirochaetota bacterium]|nr:FecR domain-containing protein [Spirochaetota bacterium]
MKKNTSFDARTGMRAGFRVKIWAALIVLLALPLAAWTDDALFVYTEGEVDVDHGYGRREMAVIGDPVRTGESVITGETGFAELERGSSTSITVQPDTIFTLEQTASEGEEREVMRCTLGSVAYRFQMIRGKEPYLVTPSAAAGIRGTEVTVTAADDGSSLFVVQSGSVEVEAQGTTVTLEADEGFSPGFPPLAVVDAAAFYLEFFTGSFSGADLDAFV